MSSRLLHLVCAVVFISVFTSPVWSQNDLTSDVDKLEKFLKSLDKDYVDEVETRKIVEEGIRRMLEELDPHSVYLDKEAYARSNEPLKGKFDGIGVRFIMVDDTMTILDVLEGGAAEMAGVRTGDQLIRIDGDTVSGQSIPSGKVTRSIKESDKDVIEALIRRKYPKPEMLAVQMKKNEVKISSVPAAFMIDNRTGYIKLERFSSTSLDDFRDGLDELNQERLKNLVIDLRGNGGGYLNIAIKIADEFLEDRRLIVYTEGEHQDKREVFATSGGRYTSGDLYILIDANSASASEILAGAIQDWDRGLIIGRRSYGKGLVQRTVEFSDGSAMRLTISRYYTPTGRSIQRSYEEGTKAYRSEIGERRSNGELFSADSINLIDTLIYYTPKQRKVYGGGGIVPDVFVPYDTTYAEELIRNIRRGALFQGFAFEMYGRHKSILESDYRDASEFITSFELSDEYIEQFSAYLTTKSISFESSQLDDHRDLLTQLIKTPLTRFLFGYEAYYQALAAYDSDIAAAMREIDRGTYKELGLN